MLNVVVSIFEVESEAYQAITELKNQKGLKTSIMSEAVLVDKKNGYYTILDNFVIEPDAMDDMAKGGLIGMCIGILGGPLGMLLGASVGSFAGVVSETDKTAETASMLEQMILKLSDNTLAIIGLAEEKDESEIDELLSKYKTIIARFDAAVVEQEVERARDMEKASAKAQFAQPKANGFSVQDTAPSDQIFKVGDAVKHRIFGLGTVTEVKWVNTDYQVRVNFAKVGEKLLFARLARLEKV